MRVLYDVGVLGLSHGGYAPATGVSRVVEHVAYELARLHREGALDLALGTSLPPHVLLAARDMVEESTDLAGVPMRGARVHAGVVRAVTGSLSAMLQERDAGFARKVQRRALLYATSALARLQPSLTARELDGVDVFHSPFHALPDFTRRAGVRRFLTVYDIIPIKFPEYVVSRGEHFLFGVIRSLTPDDWALAISERTKADLLEYRPDLDPARVFVTPLAADESRFHPDATDAEIASVRARYAIGDAPYLLSLNTLEPRKNLDRLVQAFTSLVREQRIAELNLVFVGAHGWKTERLFAAIEAAGDLRDRIRVTGYVADADLAALYRGATAFVYPSLYEGFGLPPLEAMRCGVPVITSNTSSLPEVVGDAGLLVDPTDVDGLADAMRRVVCDGSLRDELRTRSLTRAEQFSWRRCAELTLDAYRTAMETGT